MLVLQCVDDSSVKELLSLAPKLDNQFANFSLYEYWQLRASARALLKGDTFIVQEGTIPDSETGTSDSKCKGNIYKAEGKLPLPSQIILGYFPPPMLQSQLPNLS